MSSEARFCLAYVASVSVGRFSTLENFGFVGNETTDSKTKSKRLSPYYPRI